MIKPRTPPELVPEVFVSGTSPASVAAARKIGATSISYPGTPSGETVNRGASAEIRIGIIAREESSEAWRIANERFPVDRNISEKAFEPSLLMYRRAGKNCIIRP